MVKLGRPKVEIDLNLVKSLANLHCTIPEIAAVLDIPASTLKSREDFRLVYGKGLEGGKAKLRRIQFRLAETSAAMAIFLGKNLLGQKDDPLIDLSTHYHYTQINDQKLVEQAKSKGVTLPNEIERRMNGVTH